jgi:hypothetical protein
MVVDGKSDLDEAPIYINKSAASTELGVLVEHASQRLFAFGTSTIVVDPANDAAALSRPVEKLIEYWWDRPSQLVRNFLLEIDTTSKEARTHYFAAGSRLSVSAATVVGSEIIAVGSVGGEPAVLRVQLPSR